MIRKVVAITVVVAALMLIGSVSPASADTPRCVSKVEFNTIRNGMSRQQVTNIFDIPGRVTGQGGSGGYAFEFRDYRPCRPNSSVSVNFWRDPGDILRVDGKYAYWG